MPPAGAHCTFRLRAPPSCQCSISSRCAPVREFHGSGHRVHAHRWIAFQDGVAVHSEDDADVGSCIKVNTFGARREPHTVPANPVVSGRPVSLVDERKIDGRDVFVDDRFG